MNLDRSSLIEINIRKAINSVQKRVGTVFFDFKANLSYRMEISTLLMDRKDGFFSNFLTEKLNSPWSKHHLVEDNFLFIFSIFDRFQFKNYIFFQINTTNSSSHSKQNLPQFLTHFWFEDPLDPSYLTALKKNRNLGDEWPFWIQGGKYDDYRNSFNVNFQKIINNTALLPAVLFLLSN